MQKLIGQFAKFGVVGIIAFFIDYGTMLFLTEVFGVPYIISTTVGFIVSVIFNYLASMRFVFQHKEGMSRRREFVIFVVLSVIGLGLNDLLMYIGVDLVHLDYRLVKIGATAIVMVYNFVTRKIFLDAGSSDDRESDGEKADAGQANDEVPDTGQADGMESDTRQADAGKAGEPQ
ncbi:MAG: GtrA family protein [Eggerthellaceae bacterium]|nr:GtrA family protein [Eggerthellaceae bacterium]